MARAPDGTVRADPNGGARAPGRGAYVCPEPACVDAALRSGRLRRALRCDRLPAGLHAQLVARATDRTRNEEGTHG